MDTSPTSGVRERRRLRIRALRPLLFWFVGILVLLVWYVDRRIKEGTRLTFQLLEDRQPFRGNLNVKVDGQPFRVGDRVRLGNSTLTLEGPETEPFQKSVWVWFRPVDLGDLSLKRSEGTLEVKSEP